MKAATFVFLLAACGTPMRAQTNAASSSDVTIRISTGSPGYCLGDSIGPVTASARAADNITLHLPLKLRYENRRPETLILPGPYGRRVRATVAGQNAPIADRNQVGGIRDVNSPYFEFMQLEKAEPPAGPELLQCISAADRGCISDAALIPVLSRSSGLDLRGKTVQIVVIRDHSLAPDLVEKLKEKMKDRGTVWSGFVESEVLAFRIPAEPPARDCKKFPVNLK